MNFLPGKKTYSVAIIMVVYALSALYLGHMTQTDSVSLILQAAAIAGLRAGIAKKTTLP